jgi:hypothetical protein
VGFLRRQEPQPVVEEAPVAAPLTREETMVENSWFCGREIVLAPKDSSDGIVAVLSGMPGCPQDGIAHRVCAARAKASAP